MARVNPRTLPVLVALGACHASIAYQDTRTGETRVERTAAPPRALPPTARLDERGRLRFVAPLACATETVTDMATFDVVKVSPNPPTLVVGVIATGLGFVGAATGMLSDDGASSPLTYVGAGAIGLGVPLVIGPLVGNRVERNPVGVQAVRRPGASQPCGEQPVVAERATLLWSGLHVEGAVGADGGFAVSPFDFVDALEPRLPALDLAIDLLVAGVAVRIDTVIDPGALAAARAGFFAERGLDATVPPLAALEKLAQYEAGPLAASLTAGNRLRVSLAIDNVGPGRGYGVRVVLASSSMELDGRVLYLGSLAAGGRATLAADVALSDEAIRAVATPGFTLAALIRDGHDLAPPTPVRFRGVVLRTGP
jgi:hypothetical protein